MTTSSLVGGLIGQRCTPPVVCSICNVIMMPLRSGLPDHTGRLKNEEARSGPQPVLPILGVCASPCLGCRSVRGSTGVSVHAGFGQPCGGVAAACGQFCAVGGFSSGAAGGQVPAEGSRPASRWVFVHALTNRGLGVSRARDRSWAHCMALGLRQSRSPGGLPALAFSSGVRARRVRWLAVCFNARSKIGPCPVPTSLPSIHGGAGSWGGAGKWSGG